MDEISLNRRAHLKILVERAGSQTQLAAIVKLPESYISQMMGDKPMGEKTARKIEKNSGLVSGSMDKPPSGEASLAKVPLTPALSEDAMLIAGQWDRLPKALQILASQSLDAYSVLAKAFPAIRSNKNGIAQLQREIGTYHGMAANTEDRKAKGRSSTRTKKTAKSREE